MKKIGIVTFHRARNYGAVLQAYSMQETLSEKYDVSVVDYRSEVIEKMFNKVPAALKGKIKQIIKNIVYRGFYRKVKQKNELFDSFQKTYYRTDGIYTDNDIEKANGQYDVFVAGSDQIWNLRMTEGNMNYFLSFADPEKRYSYAASFGSAVFDDAEKAAMKRELEKFQSLIVREESGVRIIKDMNITDIPVKTALDPVFLMSKEQWLRKLGLKEEKKKYALVYIVARQANLIDFAKKLKRDEGVEVIYLNHYGRTNTCDPEFKEIIAAGPKEFLELLLNAEYVITTSFHAMAFSLIFNIPFYYELEKKKLNNNTRLTNLAALCGVESREITDDLCSRDVTTPDWETINRRIREQRKVSRETLFDSLKNE